MMTACYMEAKVDLIETLKGESPEELLEIIEELEEEDNLKTINIGKMWDGLHFILTGVSASTPIENNLLSEAVVGTSTFSDDESDDFISYIYPERVSEIADAVSNFNIDKALSDFSPEVLNQKGIYPDIWREEESEVLKEELALEFNNLKQYFQTINRDQKGIIVSIY